MEKPERIHKELMEKCGHIVKHFRKDLEVHDYNCIMKNPDIPFLHFARETGTDLVELTPVELLPPPGEKVPYLFGQADGPKIVKQFKDMVDVERNACGALMVMFFDGENLREIDWEEAEKICHQYFQDCHRYWDLFYPQESKIAQLS